MTISVLQTRVDTATKQEEEFLYNFSEETLAAIAEARQISKDPAAKMYSSAKELFEDCK